ncbi:helix-turn-helix domain-containing protein [Nonomuraea sp. NPDC049480]|uniref:helix-turn-helix domain-containing protein n=1 Tax=Nonomuraea sp. NPDC049480 TaxID=3364353 RepID=UPI00378A4630
MARGGRRDRPIDRGSGPVAELADDLRRLRGGLSLEEVGRRMGYHSSTVSRRLSPDELPPLEFVRAYVTACGGDPAPWEERWHQISGAGPSDDHPEPARRRSRAYAAAAAALAVLAVAATVAWLTIPRSPQAAPDVASPATGPPPLAAGRGFPWEIERMSVRILSRRFTLSGTGDVEIWANIACPPGTGSYWIALRPIGDPARYACGSWQHHTWPGVQPGTHHFELWKNADSRVVSGRGVLSATVDVVEVSPSPTRH